MNAEMSAPADRTSTATLVVAGVAPALAWAAFLLIGSQLDEDLCGTGAVPHRGQWFGADVRVLLTSAGGVVLLVTIAAAIVLVRRRRDALRASGAAASTRVFLTTLSLVSTGLFTLIVLGTLAIMWTASPC